MHPLRFAVLLSLLLAVGLAGCDTTATQPESQVVVESYLQAQAPLPTVRLTRTAGATETFDPSDQAVRDASVSIQRLDENGSGITTIDYTETNVPGIYAPATPSPPSVETETTYRLRVETDEGTSITSTTTVPGALSLLEVENVTADMTAEYQNDAQQPAFKIDPPPPPSDRQNAYLFTVTSQLSTERLSVNLTPVYRGFYDADEDSIESFRTSSSGLLNEANFSRNDDGTLAVDVPWIGVAFFGPNEVAINVVDDNYYDFLRSQSAQQNAPPGEFPNIIDHVEGGTGIFGSYAQATVMIEFTGGGEFRSDSSR